MKTLVIIDEWVLPKTPLTRKEIGARRYARRMEREAAQNARRTRPSDISIPRITDGVPANHAARTCTRASIGESPLKGLKLILPSMAALSLSK